VQVGDLVRYCWGILSEEEVYKATEPGLVLEIASWVDSGAPDRNFGINVKVLWTDGSVSLYEPDELEVISQK